MLTVLVFFSWVLLLPRPPPSSRSLRLCAWPSILLHAPLGIFLDWLAAAPPPPVQKRDAQHKFLRHRGARADSTGPLTSIKSAIFYDMPIVNQIVFTRPLVCTLLILLVAFCLRSEGSVLPLMGEDFAGSEKLFLAPRSLQNI